MAEFFECLLVLQLNLSTTKFKVPETCMLYRFNRKSVNRGLPVLDQARESELSILATGQEDRGLWGRDRARTSISPSIIKKTDFRPLSYAD